MLCVVGGLGASALLEGRPPTRALGSLVALLGALVMLGGALFPAPPPEGTSVGGVSRVGGKHGCRWWFARGVHKSHAGGGLGASALLEGRPPTRVVGIQLCSFLVRGCVLGDV